MLFDFFYTFEITPISRSKKKSRKGAGKETEVGMNELTRRELVLEARMAVPLRVRPRMSISLRMCITRLLSC